MNQSRRASLIEAFINVLAGYGIAVMVQLVVFPVFGLHLTVTENLKIGLTFTAASLLRSYAIRRLFEAHRSLAPSLPESMGPAARPET